MHGNTAPTPSTPNALSLYITPTGTYSLRIGVYSISDVASDNSDLLAKVQQALPSGWEIGYTDINATTAELSIWPPQGIGGVTAEVSGDATAEVQAYQPAYGDSWHQGALYASTETGETYMFIPSAVDGAVVRNKWQIISNS